MEGRALVLAGACTQALLKSSRPEFLESGAVSSRKCAVRKVRERLEYCGLARTKRPSRKGGLNAEKTCQRWEMGGPGFMGKVSPSICLKANPHLVAHLSPEFAQHQANVFQFLQHARHFPCTILLNFYNKPTRKWYHRADEESEAQKG